jgi:hypothetical protein
MNTSTFNDEKVISFETISYYINKCNCPTSCCYSKRQFMKSLEENDWKKGFIDSLLLILESPASSKSESHPQFQPEDRQLAAILLKNVVLKIISLDEGSREQYEDDIIAVKAFLLRSLTAGEASHQVFLQLHTLIARLANLYWPSSWKELIPTLLTVINSNYPACPSSSAAVAIATVPSSSSSASSPSTQLASSSFMISFQAICCLHEVLIQLSSKSTLACFSKMFQELCLQLFQGIAKNWAIKMKSLHNYLLTYIKSLPVMTSSTVMVSSDDVDISTIMFPLREESQEVTLYYMMIMSKILKIILEGGYIEINKRFATCFPCLWKTYMTSIQLISTFIRRIRPFYKQLLSKQQQLRQQQSISISEKRHGISILQQFCSLDIDDFNHATDYCGSLEGREVDTSVSSSSSVCGPLMMINLSMKLLKVMNCLPVHLQKKYPLECGLPLIESLVSFYFNFLFEEITSSLNGNHLLKVLPLGCLLTAAVLLLKNVLTCPQYQHPQHNMNEEPSATAIKQFLNSFFTENVTKELLQRLLVYLLHYNNHALSIWKEQPEKFIIDEECEDGGAEYLTIRTSSEQLFIALLEIQPLTASNIIIGLLKDIEQQNRITSGCSVVAGVSTVSSIERKSLTSNEELLFWDSIYTCTSLGVKVFSQQLGVSPTEWLMSIISPLFCNLLASGGAGSLKPDGQQILRVRMLKLVSSWINEFSSDVHGCILHFLTSLLQLSELCGSTGDIVVQLTTVKVLSSLLSCKHFRYSLLLPVVLPLLQSLLMLIPPLEETETKKIVFELIKEILEILGNLPYSSPSSIAASVSADCYSSVSNQCSPSSSPCVLPVSSSFSVSVFSLLFSDSLLKIWNSLPINDEITRRNLLEIFTVFIRSIKEADLCLLPSSVTDPLVCPIVASIRIATSCLSSVSSSSSSTNGLNSLTLEALLLLSTITRNLNLSLIPTIVATVIADSLFHALQTIDLHLINVINLKAEKEEGLQVDVMVERICYILEGCYFFFPKEFFSSVSSSTASSSQQDGGKLLINIYRKICSLLSPKKLFPVFRSLQILFFLSSSTCLMLLQESGFLLLTMKIVSSLASCPHLRTLMKPFEVGKVVTFQCMTLLMQLFNAGFVSSMMNACQVLVNEVLDFLATLSGGNRPETNLNESIILRQLLTIFIKNYPSSLEAFLDSEVAGNGGKQCQKGDGICLFYKQLYCRMLWLMIPSFSSTATDNTSGCGSSSLSSFLQPSDIKAFLPELFIALLDYYEECKASLSLDEEDDSEWTLSYYEHVTAMMKGSFPLISLLSPPVTPNYERCELNSSSFPSLEDVLEGIIHQEKKNSSLVSSFLQFLNNGNANSINRLQQIHQEEGDGDSQVIIEREEIIISHFLFSFLQNEMKQETGKTEEGETFSEFLSKRLMFLSSAFGYDTVLQLFTMALQNKT